jgi:hypothetical protein
VEEIPSSLAKPEEFFPFLSAAHVLPPVIFATTTATVVTTDCERCALGLRWAESRWWTAVVALILVTTTTSSWCRRCAAKVRSCCRRWRVEVTGRARHGVCVANRCSTSSGRHWAWWCRRLNAAVVHDFGLQFVTSVCERLHGFVCGAEFARSAAQRRYRCRV